MANLKKRSADRARLPLTRYLFFGGKGGVGKTTLACATALYLLDQSKRPDRILLFSTDPAHSLSDSLDLPVGDRVVEVARNRAGARLLACEMDAPAAFAEFKAKHRPVLEEIADRGTFLDRAEIRELLNLSLPGMDEVMALFRLSDIEGDGQYARIIVDTAPSGHTSRLFQLPAVFAGWTGTLNRLVEKHRYMAQHFGGGRARQETELDRFLCELVERVRRLRSILHDDKRSSFLLVTTPEKMSGEESRRYRRFLGAEGLHLTHLIINRVEEEHGDCRYCRQRARVHRPELRQLERDFAGLQRCRVPLLNQEIRGKKPLRHLGRFVWGDAEVPDFKNSIVGTKIEFLKSGTSLNSPTLELRPLWIFGGKGGVGKTTAAAAAALALACGNPQKRVLVLSIDPAHSLSDSFEDEIGGETKVHLAGEPNLNGMEIDPVARFQELKEQYRHWADRMFHAAEQESGWQIQFDRQATRELIELAPPGIDEIVALSAISDLLDNGKYDAIVLDTAPTGHLIRFLELPEIALSWVQLLMRLLLKYKDLIQKEEIAERLIGLSRDIKKVVRVLTDERKCRFVGVTTPERMSLEETGRLIRVLEKLKTPVAHLLINKLIPEAAARDCDFCALRRRSQEEALHFSREDWKSARRCWIAPELPQEVRGRRQLERYFHEWQIIADVRK